MAKKQKEIWDEKRRAFDSLNQTLLFLDDIGLTVQTIDSDRAILRIWRGSQKSPFVRYYYENTAKRDAAKEKYIQDEKRFVIQREMEKKRKKLEEKNRFENIKIGDIFVSSWGYEQTNVDFFQLVNLKGKTGEFRKISYETIEETGPMSEYVRPVPNSFIGEETEKYRLVGNSFKITSYAWGRKIEDPANSKHYHSWYA